LGNLRFNFLSARSFIGENLKYMAVVKANAYGHGLVECSRTLVQAGVDWLCVALIEEAIKLREHGITIPILCLGSFWEGQERTLIRKKITPVIFDIDRARELNTSAGAEGLTVPIHVKIDTGMGRVGVRYDVVDDFIDQLRSLSNLRVQGLMTHFAAADDLSQTKFTEEQISRFYSVVDKFQNSGFSPNYIDLANSPAAVAHPAARGNMVRLGGILYGLGGDVLPKGIDIPELRPVMSIRTRIAQLKSIPAGETLGYGRTFVTDRDTLVATIPIGYADGFPRSLSNRGQVIIRSGLAPVIGRVSMDWTIVDVTDIPGATIGDEVLILGSSGEKTISAESIAQIADTISYEITCGISARVPRLFR
jgi:alanine racemase